MKRPREIRRPVLAPARRMQAKMEAAHKAVMALADSMPTHSGPNQEFTRWFVSLGAELRRKGYLLTGDGKGGFLPPALPSAAELAERMPSSADDMMRRDITQRPEGARDITKRPMTERIYANATPMTECPRCGGILFGLETGACVQCGLK